MPNSNSTADYHHDDLADRKLTPEEITAEFRALIAELDETPTELAARLKHLGDHRTVSAISRSIQRMASGDAGVSGEMLLIAKLLIRQQRVRDQRYSNLQWRRHPNNVHSATVDGFTITLSPKTKERWHVNLVHDRTKYSPPWPSWQPDLETAKKKALTCLFDAQNDLAEIEAAV